MTDVQPSIDVRQEDGFKTDAEKLRAAMAHGDRFSKAGKIDTREEANELADAIKGIRVAVKDVHEHRLERTAQLRADTTAINVHYNELAAQAEAAEEALKDMGIQWKQREERRVQEEARAEQARIQAEAEAKAAEAAEAAAAAAEDPDDAEMAEYAQEARTEAAAAAEAPPAPPPPVPNARGSFGSLSGRKEYSWEVSAEGEIPAEYMTVDAPRVKGAIASERKAAKEQGRPFNLELIPGIRIWERETGVSR